MLVDRIINTLVGDRFHRNYKVHIFNSHTLFQLSATLKPRVYPTLDWASSRSHLFFRHHARAQLFSHTSLSFVHSSAMEYLKHSDHTTPLLYSHSRHIHSSIQTSYIFTHLWQPLPNIRARKLFFPEIQTFFVYIKSSVKSLLDVKF